MHDKPEALCVYGFVCVCAGRTPGRTRQDGGEGLLVSFGHDCDCVIVIVFCIQINGGRSFQMSHDIVKD